MTSDPFNLQRFVDAQAGTFEQAVAELNAGEKRKHWMWFVFPQLRGLGSSPRAYLFGISSLQEAKAYLDHNLLGPRLFRCTSAVLAIDGKSRRAIFGLPVDLKFRSSMTLFSNANSASRSIFQQALDRYCGGRPDEQTLGLLAAAEAKSGP